MLRTLLVSAVVAAAGTSVLAAATDGFQAFTTEGARRIAVRAHPIKISDVALETSTGGRTSLGALRGRWLVVDFVYTRCPTFCTVLGGEFAQLQDRLATPIASGRVQLLSISFDPTHDSAHELASWLTRSGDRGAGWIAARPRDAAALDRVMQSFGIIVIPDDAGGYVHNASVQLVDPQGRLVEIVDAGDPAQVARAVLRRVGG